MHQGRDMNVQGCLIKSSALIFIPILIQNLQIPDAETPVKIGKRENPEQGILLGFQGRRIGFAGIEKTLQVGPSILYPKDPDNRPLKVDDHFQPSVRKEVFEVHFKGKGLDESHGLSRSPGGIRKRDGGHPKPFFPGEGHILN